MDNYIIESAQNGSIESIIIVAKLYYDNNEGEENRGEAAKWYQKALDIDQNEVRALNGLGNCYYNGIGVECDHSKALGYYRKAAELGYVNSQYNLANELKENNDPECIEWFEKAYDQGDIDAPYDLAWIYKDGKLAPQDDQKYIYYLQKAVELNNYMAYTDLAFEYLEGGIVEKNIKKGRSLLETAAKNGNSVSASNLSVMYVKGDGVEKNIETAIEWAKKAADLGYDEQLFALGVDLFEGNNLEKDQTLALDCFVYAANLGNITAMSNAGVCYINGYGTLVSREKAIEYFGKAVSAGSADDIGKLKQIYSEEPDHSNGNWLESFLKKEASLDNCAAIGALAFMYAHGQLVEKNQAKALALYKKGADLNDGYCCYYLAGCLLTGKLGVKKNPEEATDYLFKAKKIGHLPSICMLAECYADGEGVDNNPALAFDLYMEAAEQGSAEAQFKVYNAYENGIGVEENIQKANEWLKKAADNGHELALGLMGLHARLDGDSKSAAEYWEKAIQNGNVKIICDLAELYLAGEENLPPDKKRAIELHTLAANRGYAPSQVALGVCYTKGDGVDIDYRVGTDWFRKAADLGDMYGEQNYAIALREGRGVQKNASLAIQYFQKAADQGSQQAKLCLAHMYRDAEGTNKDIQKSISYYKELLAEPDNKYNAEVKLGLAQIYVDEYKDFNSAFPLYQDLANSGEIVGVECLALFYYNGWGTTRDVGRAISLMQQAAQTDPKAQQTLNEWNAELASSSSNHGPHQSKVVSNLKSMPQLRPEQKTRQKPQLFSSYAKIAVVAGVLCLGFIFLMQKISNDKKSTGIVDHSTIDSNKPSDQMVNNSAESSQNSSFPTESNHSIESSEAVASTVNLVPKRSYDRIAGHSDYFQYYIGVNSNGTISATGWDERWLQEVKSWSDIVEVDLDIWHTVGLKSDGTVVVAVNEPNPAPDDSFFERIGTEWKSWNDIVSISAGTYHTVGVKSDGTVVAFGFDYCEDGQDLVSDWNNIIEVSAGTNHTVGLRKDGTVVAVGNNEYGQCNVSNWTDIVAISAGWNYTVGLRADGTLVETGDNENHACDVSEWSNIIAISARGFETVGLKSDGTIVSSSGNVIANDYCNYDLSTWHDVTDVYAGNSIIAGLKADGTVLWAGPDYGSEYYSELQLT